MEISVLVRIQAHPARRHLHKPLVQSLKPFPVEVSLHSSIPPNPLLGYKQALSNLPDCTHLCILQEDVIVCKNFPPAVERIARANPNTPVCLFLAKLPALEAKLSLYALKKGERYIQARPKTNSFLPAVAVLWPRQHAEHFREWLKTARLPQHPKREPASDDAAIARWALANRQRVLITVPSLVEHPDREPSLIGKRAKWGKDRGRVALIYIGEGDPLELDW